MICSNKMARRLLSEPAPGTHTIFWNDRSKCSDETVAAFLKGGVKRDDVLAVVVPRQEFLDWQTRMLDMELNLDGLADEGRLIWAGSDDLAPRNPREVDVVGKFLQDLSELAGVVGRGGVSVLGKYSCFFERGEQRMAEMIEATAEEHSEAARILCLYETQDLPPDRLPDAYALTRLHTTSITAIGDGKYFVEHLDPPRPQLA